MEVIIKGGKEVLGNSEAKKLSKVMAIAHELGAKCIMSGVHIDLGKKRRK